MDDITNRRLETRNRDLFTRYDSLTDEFCLIWVGAPIDERWWHRRLSDIRSRADSLAFEGGHAEAAVCHRLVNWLERDLTMLGDAIDHFGHDVVTRAYLDSNPIRDDD